MSEGEQRSVRVEIEGGIGLIGIAVAPVNGLSMAVGKELAEAHAELLANPSVKAIVLHGDGRFFSVGAAIDEFGSAKVDPTLPELLKALDASTKPVIAAMHGAAFGSGLELALSTQVRVGVTGLKVALPQVKHGMLPGAGGTQRLPRLTGIASAIDIICQGREVHAEEALKLGILDHLSEGTARDAGLAAARSVLDGTLEARRTDLKIVTPDPAALDAARQKFIEKRPVLDAPQKALEALSASTLPIDEGLGRERTLYLDLLAGPERQALAHAFLAERITARIPEADSPGREIASVGIVGGGTMGVGIATAFSLAGFSVRLIETEEARADAARAGIEKNLAGAVTRGKLSAEDQATALTALDCSADLGRLEDVDLVIEAVFEEMSVKTDLFGKLDRICKPGAILATNTSYLDIDRIAAATERPEAVIGLHFFSPAHIMRLLEVVVTDRTAPDLVSTAFKLARKLRKIPVRALVCDGFIGNRILTSYRKVTDYLVLDGADFTEIDNALEAFGFAMGPFAVSDLAGLDIGMMARKRQAPSRPAEERYSRIPDQICEAGWYGRKTGQGYYLYDGSPGRPPNPGAVEIIAEERRTLGLTSQSFSHAAIVDRCMTAMIAEAARVLEEGIALRPADIDAVQIFGYGFPRHRGGPMHEADRIGAAALVQRIERYAEEDASYWQVPALLRSMADDGRRFADMNGDRDDLTSTTSA